MKSNLVLTIGFLVSWVWLTNSAFCQPATAKPAATSPASEPQEKKDESKTPEQTGQDGDSHGEESEVSDEDEGPIKFECVKEVPGKVIAIELSHDGTILASGGLDDDITLHSTKDFSILATTQAPQGKILDLIFSSDDKYLVSCGDPKQVLVYEAKDLSVKFDYKVRFRPERLTESTDGEFIAGGRSGQLAALSFSEVSTKYNSVHKSFVGGLCSSSNSQTTYSAGDQTDGPYFLSRKAKKLQKIISLPSRPSRITAGKSDDEVLVATANHAMRVDVVRNKTLDLWHLADAKKVEDIIYWKQRDLYVTSDKAGYIKIWQRGNQQPVASHQVYPYDVYQVMPLDADRLIVCGRIAPPKSITVWKLDFDEKQFPKLDLAQMKALASKTGDAAAASSDTTSGLQTAQNSASSANHDEMPKVAKSQTQGPTELESETSQPDSTTEAPTEAPTEATEPKKTVDIALKETEPSPWLDLDADFEVKRINPADLKLRPELPSTKLQQERQISRFEKAKQPIPESLKNFEPLQIQSAALSPGGKLFLSTSDGLVHYDFNNGASLIKDKSTNVIEAACLARDPVDGILIGLKNENRVLELRESGELVSRGQLDPEIKSDDKTKLSVSHIAVSGSDYLALSNSTIYRRFPEGYWDKVSVQTENKPILRFSLLETREIVTSDPDSTDVRSHPPDGASRRIRASRTESHASNSRNVLTDSASNMKVKKLIATQDGDCFCVFARDRTPTGKPLDSNPFDDTRSVTAGGCTLSGTVLDNLVTSNDFDWGVDGLPKKDRTVVDLYPVVKGEPKDVWFLTPKGVGIFKDKKTRFWHTQFELDRKQAELSRIESLGDGSIVIFTTDGLHGEDIFFIRPK